MRLALGVIIDARYEVIRKTSMIPVWTSSEGTSSPLQANGVTARQ